MNFHFLFFVFFWTKIGIFYALMHKERHKCSLFYFLKIYNNCSFSFSSKMKFSISQLDVVEMKNWKHVPNGCEKTITELPSNVSEHFFKALNLWKFDLVYSKICPKFNFLSRTSFNFFDILDICTKLCDRSAGLFGIPGALILGFPPIWSTVYGNHCSPFGLEVPK